MSLEEDFGYFVVNSVVEHNITSIRTGHKSRVLLSETRVVLGFHLPKTESINRLFLVLVLLDNHLPENIEDLNLTISIADSQLDSIVSKSKTGDIIAQFVIGEDHLFERRVVDSEAKASAECDEASQIARDDIAHFCPVFVLFEQVVALPELVLGSFAHSVPLETLLLNSFEFH